MPKGNPSPTQSPEFKRKRAGHGRSPDSPPLGPVRGIRFPAEIDQLLALLTPEERTILIREAVAQAVKEKFPQTP
jgi:hypothetical protein